MTDIASRDDLWIFARTLYGEAEAGDIDDAKAIACVIMNRVKLPNWPNTVSGVCLQPWQFSCWNPGDPNRERILNASGRWFDQCVEIASQAMAGKIDHPVSFKRGRATHYYATYITAPKWAKGHKPIYRNTAGKFEHLFFNDIDTPAPKTAREALDQSKPISKGGEVVAGVGTIGTVVTEAANQVGGLIPYVDALKWVFVALVLVGLGLTVWGKLRDRQRGAA